MSDDDPQIIVPRYKLIVTYDIRAGNRDQYYQFVMGELVPALQDMGVYMTEAWHTAYGEHPIRMVIFVTEDFETMQDTLTSERFLELEEQLQTYIHNYTRKVVEYDRGFQVI